MSVLMQGKIKAGFPAIGIPKWVSHRTYTSQRGESRTILSNHLSHEIMVLEGEAAIIWHKIATSSSSHEIFETAEGVGFDKEDVMDFLKELDAAQLVMPLDADRREDVRNLRPASMPTSIESDDREAEHVTIEMDFREWCEENGFLYSAFLEVSYRCNHRCIHCFNPGAAHGFGEKPRRKRDELTIDEYRKVIDELFEAGVFKLTLSGGEFFIRQDAFDILSYAHSKGLSIEIFTNGNLLNDERVSRLAEYWPEYVCISIYSANPVLHDQVTGVSGSWQKSITALKQLYKLGIKTKVKCPVMHDTVQGYDLVRDLANSIGAQIQFDPMISAGNDGAVSPVQLNTQSFGELVVLAASEGSPFYVGSQNTGLRKRNIKMKHAMCGIGCSAISITPDGDVQPCAALADKMGSVRESGWIKAIWYGSSVGKANDASNISLSSPLTRWQNISYNDTAECGTHERCKWCNRCIGASFAQYGDAMRPSETQCFQAAARNEAARLIENGADRSEICSIYKIPESFGRIREPRDVVTNGFEWDKCDRLPLKDETRISTRFQACSGHALIRSNQHGKENR